VAFQLPGWSPDIERSFKEVLYKFLEDVHCTKAALYLKSPEGDYLLATQYGFGRKDPLCAQYPPSSDISIRAASLENRARAFNRPEEIPEIYEALQCSHSSRLLLVPIQIGSILAGFIDARDKGGKMDFDKKDEDAATQIASGFLHMIQMTGIVDVEIPEQAPQEQLDNPSKQLRESVSRPISSAPCDDIVLDPPGLWRICHALVDELLRGEELGIAALGILDNHRFSMRIMCGEDIRQEDLDPMYHHVSELMRSAGIEAPSSDEWETRRDIIETGPPNRPLLIASRILLQKKDWALFISLMGSAAAGGIPRGMERMEHTVLEAVDAAWCRYSRRVHCREILQPEGIDTGRLLPHSLAVSELSFSLALKMGLGYGVAEDAALAGLLHDVGMQRLDYEELYEHPSPGERELKIYRRHPLEGEKIVRERGFGDLAPILRSHHERWDGKGYPDRLQGKAIPLLSRIVHLAEVYDTLVSPESYKKPVGREQALATIEAEVGTQFDAEVVSALRELL